MITFSDVCIKLGKLRLENIDIKINAQEIIHIFGPNGSGKTTILNMITGLIAPTKGKILKSISAKEIGYLPSTKYFDDNLLVSENIFLIYKLKTGKNVCSLKELSNSNSILDSYINDFEIAHIFNMYPHELSRGQYQKAMFLASLIGKNGFPKLLILDEPFNFLDIETKNRLDLFLHQLMQINISIVYVSHEKIITDIPERFSKKSIDIQDFLQK